MEREIGQLWLFAKHYFSLAKRWEKKLPKAYLNKTPGYMAKKYPNPYEAPPDAKRTMLMTAHLSSCCVRLYTIDDKLQDNSIPRIFNDKYWIKIDENRTVSDIAKELDRDKDKYIHQMLRDNVAHPEREKGRKKETIYQARQQIIEKLTYQQIYDSVDKVVQKFKKQLIVKNILCKTTDVK